MFGFVRVRVCMHAMSNVCQINQRRSVPTVAEMYVIDGGRKAN